MDKRIAYLGAAIIAIGTLPLPYGYYTFLKIVACALFGALAYYAHKQADTFLAVVAGLFIVLFNPLIPVYLSKDIWIVIDVIGAIAAIVINQLIINEK